ncbi:shikimate kinase 1 [Ruminiclostridium hungatei]|uniref:Shikimate kinase n=1 Tax=Ruminiclostridium hungatei TaxID=48256 RepID=A0A1V4SFB4_RUMHU|nr:shikimate kinase [Ruminiclostridium hungatei]OPX42155.1 shikimate kinase 1 [Ruminiclostridium hungatei]
MISEEAVPNIILIGMPGTGKTTVGEKLSEILGYGFMDTDSVLTAKTGKTPRQLVEEHGREYFLKLQDDVVLQISTARCVISTGGGIVHSAAAMEHLKIIGKVVFLNTSYQAIEARMDTNRKLVRNGSSLLQLYDERTPLYNKYADTVIQCDNCEPQTVCEKIIDSMK